MIDFILNIVVDIIGNILVIIIPFAYYIALMYYIIKNKWHSSVFKNKFVIFLYFIFPPLAWYDSSMQMQKKRFKKKIRIYFSIITSIYLLLCLIGFCGNLSYSSHKHNQSTNYVYIVMLIFLFAHPICILVSEIVRRNLSKK